MPVLFKMSDEKQTTESPAVVIAETTAESKRGKTRKYVIIAVAAIVTAAIILTAILVGMYIFSEAQKEIIKYTLNLNNNAKQEVTSDPNANVVQYHFSSAGQEVWTVNDFNKDIQVVKIQTSKNTVCYLSALNRTTAMDPSKIVKPASSTLDVSSGSDSLIYVTSNTPVSDSSFLSKAARDLCSGISVYWVYPQCSDNTIRAPNGTDVSPRNKRNTYNNVDVLPFYQSWYEDYNGGYVFCVRGCCRTVCACDTYFSANYNYTTGQMSCSWYIQNCPPTVVANPAENYCSKGPTGLICPNKDPATPPTC